MMEWAKAKYKNTQRKLHEIEEKIIYKTIAMFVFYDDEMKFYRVSWLFFRLILLHIGFGLPFTN
jgi:hypothetical protein